MKYSALQQVVEEDEEDNDELTGTMVRRTPTPVPDALPTTNTGSSSSTGRLPLHRPEPILHHHHPHHSCSSVCSTGNASMGSHRNSNNNNHSNGRQECLLFLATICGFLMLVAALSLHDNEWVGGEEDQYMMMNNGGDNNHDHDRDNYMEPVRIDDHDFSNNNYGGLRGRPLPPSERMPPFSVVPEEEEESVTDTWWGIVDDVEAEDITPVPVPETEVEEDTPSALLHQDSVVSQDEDEEDTYSTLPLYGNEDEYETQLENTQENAARIEDEHEQGP